MKTDIWVHITISNSESGSRNSGSLFIYLNSIESEFGSSAMLNCNNHQDKHGFDKFREHTSFKTRFGVVTECVLQNFSRQVEIFYSLHFKCSIYCLSFTL